MNLVKKVIANLIRLLGLQPFVLGVIKAFHLDRFFLLRVQLSYKYLRGTGLEIGAMHGALKVPSGVDVKYVDIATKEESVKKFPQLNPIEIVDVDYVMDGFTLTKLPSEEFDFLVANSVLEHSQDPVGTLINWFRVLKSGGILYCALPRIDHSFDNGRQLTTPQHMLEDHRLVMEGRLETLRERNKEHYREWHSISLPFIEGVEPLSPELIQSKAEEFSDSSMEIHFHTFSLDSVRALFKILGNSWTVRFSVLEIIESKIEVLVILKKISAINLESNSAKDSNQTGRAV